MNLNNVNILEIEMVRRISVFLVVLGVLVCAFAERAEAGRCPVVVDRTLSYAIGIAVVPAADGVSGAWAFSGSGEVLKVIDVSDPARPALAGRLVLQDKIRAIAARADRLYVWTGPRRLNIVDAEVPKDPRLVGWVDLEDLSLEFPRIEVAGDHAFISGWGVFGPEQCIRVIDVGDPDAPVEVARIDGAYGNTAISGSTLCGLTNEADTRWRVDFFDISDPTAPALLGSYRGPANDFAGDLLADGTFVYVETSAGLEIIDIGDPAHPIQIGADDSLRLLRNSWLSEGHIYTQVGSRLEVIDVRDPHNPVLCGSCETPWTYGQPAAMVFSEGLAFMSYAYQGLVVIDISDPSNPAVIGQLVEWGGLDVAVAGRYCIRLRRCLRQPPNMELRISDLGAPGGPTEIGRYETDWEWPTMLAVEGSSAYLMSRSGAVEAVDIGDPSEPRQAGRLETVIGLSDIAVAKGVVYLAGDGSRPGCRVLQILDASDLIDPDGDAGHNRNYAVICDLGRPISVAASGSYAYLGTESALAVIDVTNPSAAFEVARVATPALAVAIQRGYAYIAAGVHGLRVYDVRVPAAPQLVSELTLSETFWGPDEAVAITVAGRRAYLGSSRLHAIDISDPTRPRVLWNYPRELSPLDVSMGIVSELAVGGSSAFLGQSSFGSAVLDISGCRQPHRDASRPGSENP